MELIKIKKTEEKDMSEVINLLQDISSYVPDESLLEEIWDKYSAQPNLYSVVTIKGGTVIGYGSILIETKIRGGKVGHIEDVVTHSGYRSKGVGGAIIKSLIAHAEKQGCYKTILQCKEKNIGFYEKLECERSGVTMQRYIDSL